MGRKNSYDAKCNMAVVKKSSHVFMYLQRNVGVKCDMCLFEDVFLCIYKESYTMASICYTSRPINVLMIVSAEGYGPYQKYET